MQTIKLLTTIFLLGTSTLIVYPQSNNRTVDNVTVIYEAYYSGRGNSWRTGKHLIAKVYSNGRVEFDDLKANGIVAELVQREVSLTSDELAQFRTLLKRDSIRRLDAFYGAYTTTIDHTEDLIINIIEEKKTRTIVVENFKPDLQGVKRKYPRDLVSLACLSENIRKGSNVRFFFRETVCSID